MRNAGERGNERMVDTFVDDIFEVKVSVSMTMKE